MLKSPLISGEFTGLAELPDISAEISPVAHDFKSKSRAKAGPR